LQRLAELWALNKEKAGGFSESAVVVADVIKNLAEFAAKGATAFYSFGRAIGATAAQLDLIAHGEFAKARQVGLDFLDELKSRQQAVQKSVDAINGKGAGAVVGPPSPPKSRTQAPSLGSTDAQDTSKKLLDLRIKALENSIREEKDLLKDREHFLDRYYQDDQLGIKEYFDRRQEIIRDSLAKEIAAYDAEIAALRASQAKATPKDRVDTEIKIADAVDKRAKAQKDASLKSVDLWFDEKKAADAFRSSLDDISLKLLEMQGNTVQAAAFGFDIANAQLRKRIDLERQSGDEQTRTNADLLGQKLADYRKLTVQQAELNDLQKQFGLIVAEVGIAQASIGAQREAGSITELEALAKLSKANQARISELTKVAEAYEAIARATGDKSALVAADALRVKIQELAATGDLVAKKFNDIFADAFVNGLTDIVTGTKSVKDAFKDMERSIVAAITRIAAQEMATKIFGGSGGIGSFFSQIFGKGGFDWGSLFGSSGGISPGAFIPPGGGYAGGTDFARGGLTLVGERGPELVNMRRGAQVIPNDVLRRGGMRSVINNITISVPASTSGASADQIAMRTGAAIQRAMRRNA